MLAKEYEVLCQRSRQVFTKIEILSPKGQVIGEIVGNATEGSYDITEKTGIRRTCNVTIVTGVEDNLLSKRNLLWINRRFRLYQGIKNMRDETIWFLLGTFAISNPDVDCNLKTHNVIEIEGLDYVSLIDDTFGNGAKEAKIVVEPGGNLSKAIYDTLCLSGDESIGRNANIEWADMTVPYKIERKRDDSLWDTLKELVEMYLNYEGFFDARGIFNYRRCSNLYRNAVVWDFTQNNLLLKVSEEYDYKNFRNQVDVYGRTDDETGKTPEAHMPDEKAVKEIQNEFDNDKDRIALRNKVYELQLEFTKAYEAYVKAMEDYYKGPFEKYKKAREEYNKAIDNKMSESDIQKRLNYLNRTQEELAKEYEKVKSAGEVNDKTRNAYVEERRKLDALSDIELDLGDDQDMLDLGESMKRRLVIKEDKYFEYDHCRRRAEYEFDKRFNCAKKIKVDCVPIYNLDVNQLVYIKDEEHNIDGKYAIDSISCDLGYQGKMRITCHKVYRPRFEIDTLATPKKLSDIPNISAIGKGGKKSESAGGSTEPSDPSKRAETTNILTKDNNGIYYALPRTRLGGNHAPQWGLLLRYCLTPQEEPNVWRYVVKKLGKYRLSYDKQILRRMTWRGTNTTVWRGRNGEWNDETNTGQSLEAYLNDDGSREKYIDYSYWDNFANAWLPRSVTLRGDNPSEFASVYYLEDFRPFFVPPNSQHGQYKKKKPTDEVKDVNQALKNGIVEKSNGKLVANAPNEKHHGWVIERDHNRNWYATDGKGEYFHYGLMLSEDFGWVGELLSKDKPPIPLSEVYKEI